MNLLQALIRAGTVLYCNYYTCLFSLLDYELLDTDLFIIYLIDHFYRSTVLNQFLLSDTVSYYSGLTAMDTHIFDIFRIQ